MLDTERAAAIARARARSVEAQARSLLDGRGVPVYVDGVERRFKPMWSSPVTELAEVVKQRWPEMDAEQQHEIVAAAERLQGESASATRHIDPETLMAEQQAAMPWLREWRRRNPDRSLHQGWEALCADPQVRKVTQSSFGTMWYDAAPVEPAKAAGAGEPTAPAQVKGNGGIPKRSPPPPAKKVAERSIAPAVERWDQAGLHVFVVEQLRANPDATTKELWEAACKLKQPHVTEGSFRVKYVPEARKALTLNGHEPKVTLPAQNLRKSDEDVQPAAESVRVDAEAVHAPPPGEAPSPVAEAPVALLDPVLRNTESEASAARLERPGSIEISRPRDSFQATQRPDGMWDVLIRAEAVEHPVMDQLAAVMWDRIVGIRGGGAREQPTH